MRNFPCGRRGTIKGSSGNLKRTRDLIFNRFMRQTWVLLSGQLEVIRLAAPADFPSIFINRSRRQIKIKEGLLFLGRGGEGLVNVPEGGLSGAQGSSTPHTHTHILKSLILQENRK